MGEEIVLAAVVGGRPNLMKMSPVLRAFEAYHNAGGYPQFRVRLVHTGLPNDPRLNDTSWGDVQMPRPDIHLGVGAGTSCEQIARSMLAFERMLNQEHVGGVVVVGDSEAAVAAAWVAAKKGIPIFHVESGLRSGDLKQSDEVNRVITDSLSSRLLTPSPDANENLLREGCAADAISCVGNVMVDNLMQNLERSKHSDVLERLGLIQERVGVGAATSVLEACVPKYGVLSLTRPENLERPEVLAGILQTMNGVARSAPVMFPIPATTRKKLEDWELDDYFTDLTARLESFGGGSPGLPPGLYTVPPISYLDFLRLLSKATVVITDSGGIQEETTAMGIPCLTLREETERPITVTEGTNSLVGSDRNRLRREALAALSGHGKKGRIPHFWDGHAAERVTSIIAAYYRKPGR